MTLRMESVELNLAGRQVLPPTSLIVPAGQIMGLTAPSGAGKTSLLSIASLLQRPDAGCIIIDGIPIPAELATSKIPVAVRRNIGMLPQNPRNFADPRLTLAETITAPLAFRDGKSRPVPQRYQDQLLRLTDQVQLSKTLLGRFPSQVSDGQLQRALMARALSLDPKLILGDEPTSALDPTTTNAILSALRTKAAEGAAVLIASHDRNSLTRYCDAVLPLADLHQASIC